MAGRDSLWHKGRISYRETEATLTYEDMRKLRAHVQQAGNGDMAAWTQQVSRSISCESTGGSMTADILWIEGNAALVWDLQLAAGTLPGAGDKEGCALSLETALSLFGSTDIIGQEVVLDGHTYTVRGIFRQPDGLTMAGTDPGRPLALFPAAGAPESMRLSAIDFAVYQTSEDTPQTQIQLWMQEAGVYIPGSLQDDTDAAGLYAFLATLPAYLLGLLSFLALYQAAKALCGVGVAAWQRLKEDRLAPWHEKAQLLGAWGVGLLLIGLLAAIVLGQMPALVPIPPAYLPTRWSDFSFWGKLADDAARRMATRAMSPVLRPDLAYARFSLWGNALILAALLCLMKAPLAFRRHTHGAPAGTAWAMGIAVCAAPVLALAVAPLLGWVPTRPEALPALPLLFFFLITGLRIERFPQRWIPFAQDCFQHKPKRWIRRGETTK